MNVDINPKPLFHSFKVLLTGVALLVCTGCQTFTLSEEDFERQQRGEMVDRKTGELVATVGTAGYYGAMLGQAVAAALGK
jgi:hypothetical protein